MPRRSPGTRSGSALLRGEMLTTGTPRWRPMTLGDVAERHAFVGHTVQPCSRRSVFESEPVEVRRVERVNCGPPVGAVADVGSHPFFAGSADQTMGETVVIQVAVHQRRRAGQPMIERPCRPAQSSRSPSRSAARQASCHFRSRARPCTTPGRKRVPLVLTSGRSEPASTSPIASTARRSASAAATKSLSKSCR